MELEYTEYGNAYTISNYGEFAVEVISHDDENVGLALTETDLRDMLAALAIERDAYLAEQENN